MPDGKLSVAEFAAKIKIKYPVYKDMDDAVLTEKIIKKFPVYKEQVDFTIVPAKPTTPPVTQDSVDFMNQMKSGLTNKPPAESTGVRVQNIEQQKQISKVVDKLPALKKQAIDKKTSDRLLEKMVIAPVGTPAYNAERATVESELQDEEWMPPMLQQQGAKVDMRAMAVDDFAAANKVAPEEVEAKINSGEYLYDNGKVKLRGDFLDNLGQGLRDFANNVGLALRVSGSQSDNEKKYHLNEFFKDRRYDNEYGADDLAGKAGRLIGDVAPFAIPYADIPLMGLSNVGANAQTIWSDPNMTDDEKIAAINGSANDALMIGVAQGAAFRGTHTQAKPSLLSRYAPTSKLKYKFTQNVYNNFNSLVRTTPKEVSRAAAIFGGTEVLNNLNRNANGVKVDWSHVPEAVLDGAVLDLIMKLPKVVVAAKRTISEAVRTGYDKINPEWFNRYNKETQDALNTIAAAPEPVYREAIKSLENVREGSQELADAAKTQIEQYREYYNALPTELPEAKKAKALHLLSLKAEATEKAAAAPDPAITKVHENRAKTYEGLLDELVNKEEFKTDDPVVSERLKEPEITIVTPEEKAFVEETDGKIQERIAELDKKPSLIGRVMGKDTRKQAEELRNNPEKYFDEQAKLNPERKAEIERQREEYISIKEKLKENDSSRSTEDLAGNEQAATGENIGTGEDIPVAGEKGVEEKVVDSGVRFKTKEEVADAFKEQTGDNIEAAKTKITGVEVRNGMRDAGNLKTPKEPQPYSEDQLRLIEIHDAFTKKSPHLFHTTKSENISSIAVEGLSTGKKQRFGGVSSENKISLAANEEVAKYYGGKSDVVIRVRKDFKFDDLEGDLLAGDGAYTTGKNIPPEFLEVKSSGGKWIPIRDYVKEAQKRDAVNSTIETERATMEGGRMAEVEINDEAVSLPEPGYVISDVYLKEGNEKGMGSGQELYIKALNEHGVLYSFYPVSQDALRAQNKLAEKGLAKIDEIELSDGSSVRKITSPAKVPNPATQKAKELGYDNEHQALNSVNKRLGKEYKSFEEIPAEELQQASEQRLAEKAQEPKGTGEGVKKKVLTERAYEGSVREEFKKHLEEKGLYRDKVSPEKRSRQAQEIINEFGYENAVAAVRSGDVVGAVATSIVSKAIAKNLNDAAKLTATDVEALDALGRAYADMVELQSRISYEAGELNSQFGWELENNPDLQYNVESLKKKWKEDFGEDVPAETLAKWKEREAEIKDLKKKLAEAEERAKAAEEQQAVLDIKEALQREKKTAEKKQYADKALQAVQNLRKKIKGNNYSDVTGMVAIVDTALGIIETSIKAGMKASNAIEKGIAFIKDKLKEQGVEKWEKEENFRQDATAEFEKAGIKDKKADKPRIAKKGDRERLVVPESLIRDLVEQGNDTIETLTTAVRDIIKDDLPDVIERQVRDAITDYGRTVNLNKGELETKIRSIKRIGKVLSAIEDVQKKMRPLRSGMQRDKLDAKERGLQKQLRELMKELPMDEQTAANQQKTQLDAAKTRVQNQIEDLTKEIETRQKVQKSKKTLEKDQELLDLIEQRDKLKAEHEKIFLDEAEIERQRIVNTKIATQKRIEELERRLKEKDFSTKPKKPLIKDSEVIKLQAEKLRLQEAYDVEFHKKQLANRTKAQKVKDFLWDIWGIPRLLLATGEMSFMLIQGGIATTSYLVSKKPGRVGVAIKRSLMFFASEKKTEQWLREIKSQDYYPELKESKLALTEPNAELTAREELFYSGFTDVIWRGLGYALNLKSRAAYEYWVRGNPFKRFERAAAGYLDTLRVYKFLDGKEMLETKGVTFRDNPQAYKDLANMINTFTGRASLGKAEMIAPELSKVFFSPRNWASVIKTATPYAFYHFGKMRAGTTGAEVSVAQKMALTDFSKFVGLTTSMVMLAAAYLNNDDDPETGVEFDPTSSDFMKVKIGDTRVDPWGGRIQQVVLISRLCFDSIKKDDGKTLPLGVPFETGTKWDLIAEQATNKLNPAAGLTYKYLTSRVNSKGVRKDRFGNELTPANVLQENTSPIYWGTISELSKDGIDVMDGVLAFYAFLGGGVSTYGDKKKK